MKTYRLRNIQTGEFAASYLKPKKSVMHLVFDKDVPAVRYDTMKVRLEQFIHSKVSLEDVELVCYELKEVNSPIKLKTLVTRIEKVIMIDKLKGYI